MVPKLRFAGFCDKWNSSTLSDAGVQIIDGDRGSNYPSSGDFRPMGFCLFLNAGNVTRDGFRFDNVMFITEEKDSELRKGKLQRRDIVLTTRGTIGNTAIYNNQVSFEHIRINSGMVLVRTKQTLTPDFLYLYFSSGHFSSWLNKVAFGSAQPQLTVKIINALSVYFPGKNEQIKIADFLSSVDEKITLLSKQHDLLRQYKKGMMQKIFSQKFRFKDGGEKDFPEWGEVTLENIGSFFSGGTPTSTNRNYYNGVIPFIRSAEINSDSTELFISEEGLNSSSAKLVNKGDILYALYGATSGEVGISKIHGAINQAILCIRSTLNTSFLYYFLKSSKEQIVSTYIQGGQGNLSAEIIRKLKVPTPSTGEQTKIANFLSSLDDKIAAKKAELDKLKTWKQGLLQQMFV